MAKNLKEKIRHLEEITPAIYKMTILSEYISENALPGQFINVKCGEGMNALLRRPLSVCNVDRGNKTFDIIFRVKGTGTRYLSEKEIGADIDLIGPLGNPFSICSEYKRVAIVGGGLGIFPLLFLLKEIDRSEISTFLGFKNRDVIMLADEFRSTSDEFFISTDDGSVGYKGQVADMLKDNPAKKRFDIIYACGPVLMMKSVADTANACCIKCQVCLEERMGCGIGACLVCACKIRNKDGWEYKHVCRDGPVFWSNEVVFDNLPF